MLGISEQKLITIYCEIKFNVTFILIYAADWSDCIINN